MIGKFSGPRRTVNFLGECGPTRDQYRQQNRSPRIPALPREQESEARAIYSAQTY
jgi:hypothetical protein